MTITTIVEKGIRDLIGRLSAKIIEHLKIFDFFAKTAW